MKIQYTIRVEADLLERAKKAAEKEMRSLNNFIEVAIARHVEVTTAFQDFADSVQGNLDKPENLNPEEH